MIERTFIDIKPDGVQRGLVWDGESMIKDGRKLIGATVPQKSKPGAIRGDFAIVSEGTHITGIYTMLSQPYRFSYKTNKSLRVFTVRNIIHGSDGLETAKDEINLWFKLEELMTYTSNQEKWVYGVK
ncbi:putative nucleoside-diphosphate kinase [Helianthus anomalus]